MTYLLKLEDVNQEHFISLDLQCGRIEGISKTLRLEPANKESCSQLRYSSLYLMQQIDKEDHHVARTMQQMMDETREIATRQKFDFCQYL